MLTVQFLMLRESLLMQKINFKLFLKSIFLILIITLFIKVDFRLQEEVICCSDDHDYYSHSETIALDFDLDYSNQLEGFENKRYNLNDKVAPIGFIGSGFLASPFLFFGNIFDNIISLNSGVSFKVLFYSFSSIFYLFLTLKYLISIKNLIGSEIKDLYIMIFYLGSGISYYAFERYSMTHIYEAFTITMISYFVIKLQKNTNLNYQKYYIFYLTLFLFLGVNVRWVNYYIFLLPIFLPKYLNINNFSIYKSKLFLSNLIIFTILTLKINQLIYGIYTINPNKVYSSDIIDNTLSNLFSVETFMHYIKSFSIILFSQEFGILYFFPVLFFSLFLLVIKTIKNSKELNNYIGLVMFAQVFIIVILWQSTASSYGFRYLYNLLPLSIIVLVNEFQFINKQFISKFLNLLLLLSIFSLTSTIFFETTELTQLSLENKINSFGNSVRYTQPEYLKGYLLSFTSLNSYLKIFATSYFGMFFFKSIFVFIKVEEFFDYLNKIGLNLNDEKVYSLLLKYENLEIAYVFINFIFVLLIYKYVKNIVFRNY